MALVVITNFEFSGYGSGYGGNFPRRNTGAFRNNPGVNQVTFTASKPILPFSYVGSSTTEGLYCQAARVDWMVCAALFIGTLAVYLRTLCPTIFADDCDEIATAVATGGVMHPPGYPLYTLIGGLLIHSINFGEPAWRLGLLSCFAASACAPLVYCLSRRYQAGRVWASISAIVFGFSLCLWQQATKVETYTLNALLVALVFTLSARACESGRLRDFVLATAMCGLSLTNHLTSSCALLGAAWLLIVALRRQTRPLAAAVLGAACAVAPLGLYALLWVHAAAHPGGQVWGEPDTWRRFYLHVSGARYHDYLHRQSVAAMWRRDFLGVPALLWRNIGPLLVGVVPGFAKALLSKRPATRVLAIAMLIALAAYAVETSIYGILNIFEYYTVPLMLICIASGAGCEAIVVGIARRVAPGALSAPGARWPRIAAMTSCAATLIVAPSAHWDACDRSHATFMRDFALNTLRTMPANAVLITVGDNRVFPLWYAQDVLGVRRDVAVVPRNTFQDLHSANGRAEMAWAVKMLAAHDPRLVDVRAILSRSEASATYAQSQQAVWEIGARALETGRPLLITDLLNSDYRMNARGVPILQGIRPNMSVVAAGLADQVVPAEHYPSLAAQARVNAGLEAKMKIEAASDRLMADEPDQNFTNVMYSTMLQRTGQMIADSGDVRGALPQLREAAALNPNPSAYDALGVACAKFGLVSDAIAYCSQASEAEPGNPDYAHDLDAARSLMARTASADASAIIPGGNR